MIREILSNLQLDADAFIAASGSVAVSEQYDRNTEDAVDQGVLGAPAYLFEGEQFWGQDRIELLAEKLESQPGMKQ